MALQYTLKKAAKAPQYALWAIPAVAGGAWFIWPAVSEETKISWGIKADSEAAAMEVAAKEELKKPVVLEELDKSAKKAIENAYKAHGHVLVVDPLILAKRTQGDFSDLYQDWEKFHLESLKYDEDDGT